MNLKMFVLKNCTCYYFDDIIKLEDFTLDNTLIDKKSHENILIYSILYKTLIDPKPLRFRFYQIDRFIRMYDGTRYLTMFGSEEYEDIYNRVRNPKKWYQIYFSHYFAKIEVDFYDSLPMEKFRLCIML